MNCMVMCEITLSKKLEKFVEPGEPVSIHIDSIRGNRGRGMMRIVLPEGIGPAALNSVGETSLIFKVVSAEEDTPSIGSGHPNISMFSGSANVDGKSALEKKMLAHADADSSLGDPHPMSKVQPQPLPPEVRQPSPQAREQPVVGGIPPVQRPQPQPQRRPEAIDDAKAVMSYDDLMAAVAEVRDIDREVVVPKAGMSKEAREAAISAFKNIPRMSTHVYVKNLLKSCLVIQDMPLSEQSSVCFQPGEACDLSRFPAKLVRDSNDLRWCIETGKIGFSTRAEYVKYYESMSGQHDDGRGLKVFGSRREAERGMGMGDAPSVEDDGKTIDVEDRDGEVPFGDDRGMESLLKTMPTQK